MLRHEFQPGRLVAGFFLGVAGAVYAGDAGGAWDTPWFVVFPLVVGGLSLAGVAAMLSRSIRRRHKAPPAHGGGGRTEGWPSSPH